MRISIYLSILFLVACTAKRERKVSVDPNSTSVKLKYATGFTITKVKGGTMIEVLRPYQNASSSIKYLLVKRGNEIPAHAAEVRIIQVPVRSIVCTSTTHIPLLDYLDATNKLVGFPTTDYISSTKMRQRIDSGYVTDLGNEDALDLENLAVLKPDLLMAYSLTGKMGQFKKIEELGIPIVINAEYLETHPLGRAEWIKFMAALLDKEEQANEVFSIIETNYNTAKDLIASNLFQPSAMSGVVYNDSWFLPGGQNYATKILKDAGYRYLWESDSSEGFLKLSFEAVYEKAQNAEYWIGVANFQTLKELKDADNRYSLFKAFKTGNVYTYDVRKGAKGGSEYFELGYLRPDIILKDLIKIAHPELLPDHQLYFHARLK